ncbi:MAG: gliding motility-associated C-terminal domain-containing protein [Flavobacteriales bacterium]|nr:gliding motility-associated C-terminal domain-containing protein [Flavobacteriales bacterium]
MVWFAMIPDPAIGQNSSPDFGNYPLDAYFCTTSPKIIQYPITDADGDSLVYSLVAPLDGNNTSNGNQAGAGGYPFYPPLVFQGGYSLTNYIGGSSPMTMDQATGQIFAAPTNQGFFTFAIRVEEFRDTTTAQNGPKIKIGEVRRDVQYASLICTTGNPPVFIDPSLSSGDIVPIPYNKLYCRDFVMADINTSDTVFMNMTSPIFDSGAVKVTLIPDANDSLTFLTNWNGSFFTDTTKTDTNYFDIALGLEFNEGTIGQRFCWTPGCDQVGQTFPFQVNGFSNGCDGLSKDSLPFFITVVPPSAELDYVGAKSIPYGQEYCKNIIFEDTSIVDLLNIEIISDIFNEGAEYPSISSNFVYNSFEHANSVTTGVPNGAQNTQFLATRFCWTPDCEHIGGSFNVRAILSSIDCPTAFKKDTMDFVITVTPPFDSLDVVPNVITPNGDGINDFYRIGGISNPCNDEISVKIYSRWGTLVYESKIPTFEWSGTNKSGGDVPNGTYFVLVSGIYGSEVVTLDQRTVTVLR